MRGIIRWHLTGALVVLVTLTGALPAQALPAFAPPAREWPVTPAALGSLYGTEDPDGFASQRIWGPAAWCYIQPTEDADIAANLARNVAPQLDQVERAGGTAVLTIGHPAPWVFENNPQAVKKPKLWACGDHAAGRAIPSPKSLRPNPDGTRSVQAQRFRDYVIEVVEWLEDRYEGEVPIALQVWNEPNIKAGLEPGLPIPGAAKTAKEAAASLYAYDSIAYDVIRERAATSWLSLGSSTTILSLDRLTRAYFARHAKQPRIDEIHFNLYSYNIKSVDKAVAKWDKRARIATRFVRKHKKLRGLPIKLSEVNLNLINDPRRLNERLSFANPVAQRRMATATQMNAYYHGIESLYWLVPWRKIQTAVHLVTEDGNPARDALVTLQSSLIDKTFLGCKQRAGVRTCRLRADDLTTTSVLWRNAGISTVRAPATGELVEMTGVARTVLKGQKLRIGTTPVVLRPLVLAPPLVDAVVPALESPVAPTPPTSLG